MYTALEVAKYIINKCIGLGRPISNLQLQKILYYVQGEYMSKTNGEPLFEDNFEAWQYGPVVPKVYYKYNIYSASEITDVQQGEDIPQNVRNIIDNKIEEKSKYSAWNLVEQTHSEAPWINTFDSGRGNGDIILKDQLKKFFCAR